MIEEVKGGIKVSKELLDTLPKNNIKNRKKYQEVLEQTSSDYSSLLDSILKEINKRHDIYCAITSTNSLSDKANEIKFIKDRLYLLNEYNTSYEKLNFDKILYNLNHFYNGNLDKVNESILECIEIFRSAGICLSYKDFDFSEYTKEYMKVLLSSEDKDEIEKCFESVYWKCSNLLIHIELNIKHLYYKHKNEFEKYVSNLRKEFFENSSSDEVISRYQNLLIEYDDILSKSINLGIDKFCSKLLNINDYDDLKIEKVCSYFSYNYKNDEDFYENVKKLSNSSIEYKNYLYFSYIISDLRKIYESKDMYKNSLKKRFKEIQKKEFTLFKYNLRLSKFKKEKYSNLILKLLDELEDSYKALDEDIFNDKICRLLDSDSSIYEALFVACSHYLYIVKSMKDNNKTNKFSDEQEALFDYLVCPYNNLIKNISLTDDKNIPLIISDKYKLYDLNVTKDILSTQAGIDEIIMNASKIDIYKNIVSKVSYNKLKFLCESKDIIS